MGGDSPENQILLLPTAYGRSCSVEKIPSPFDVIHPEIQATVLVP
jgi:hypothetical protein